MTLLRTLTASARLARTSIAPPSGAWGMAAVQAVPQARSWRRAFASETGFLDRGQVADRVLEVVRKFEKVQPEKVTEKSHFVTDLGLDSLDAVELVMALEDEFAIEISDADAEKILSCDDAVSYLSNNVNAQ